MTQRRKFSCPGCNQMLSVRITPDLTSVKCPKCSKKLSIKSRTARASENTPSHSDEAKQPPLQSAAANDFGSDETDFDDSEDHYSVDLYSEGEFDDGLYGSGDGDTHMGDGVSMPPRRKKAKKKRKQTQTDKTEILRNDRRSASDELTPGTFNKPQYFSEEGAGYIKRLLLRIGIFAAVALIGGFLVTQFQDAGLVDKPESDKPVVPKAVPSQDELLDASLEYARTAMVGLRAPANTQLVEREVNLTVSGSEDPVVRECLKRILRVRAGLIVVDEPSSDLITVEVRYEEHRYGKPISLDKFHRDTRTKRPRPPVAEWGADQKEVEVDLDVLCNSPDGARLARDSVTGKTQPIIVDFMLPADFQFRAVSVLDAGRELELKLPTTAK